MFDASATDASDTGKKQKQSNLIVGKLKHESRNGKNTQNIWDVMQKFKYEFSMNIAHRSCLNLIRSVNMMKAKKEKGAYH